MKKLKIVFAGLYDDDNLGDPVIARCTESLFTSRLPMDSFEVDHVSINHFCFHPGSWLTMKWIGLTSKLPFDCSAITDRLVKRDYDAYFDNRLADADVVVVVGGGLIEFTGGRFADGLHSIASAGKKHGFPVIITATGVEGYDGANKRCTELKDMLHLESVRYVSTRDDLNTLVKSYLDGGNTGIICEKVADPAVWASEIFGISRDRDSDVIGLGVVRKNIFKQYGLPFDEAAVIDLYTDLFVGLTDKGYHVKLFTNGTKDDNDAAMEVAERIKGKGYIPEIVIPTEAKELVMTLSKFRGVIAGRLHSCIISYSLGIPAVGLVWNDKLRLFGEESGHPDNFIAVDALRPETVIERLESAVGHGYDSDRRAAFRDTIIEGVRKCVDSIIMPLF